ncbi:MAG: protein-L-isoaspartate(D-aspartate) O-methyltransferase [Geminicoccaceae bacterium]
MSQDPIGAMLEAIDRHAASTAKALGRDHIDPRVMAAVARVPRDQFVPEADRHLAWGDHPLPIGHGQTISQPFIVAFMTDLLDLQPAHRVLEVGTGCGYQAAVLAELADSVDTIEVVPELAAAARAQLARLGYANVRVHVGDGRLGLEDRAPFDRIIVTAAPERVPEALTRQLAPGGRLVIPVGAGPGTDAHDHRQGCRGPSHRKRHDGRRLQPL